MLRDTYILSWMMWFSKIFNTRLKCFIFLSSLTLLWRSNKLYTQYPDTRNYIFILIHRYSHHDTVTRYEGTCPCLCQCLHPSAPASSPICRLSICVRVKLLFDAAGLPLKIIIVHYYVVLHYVIFKYLQYKMHLREPISSPNISYSVTKSHGQLPGSRLP